jgi:hypothetical protein
MMATTRKSFDLIVGAVATLLKPLGYRRRGATFLKENPEVVGMINIQRSTKSTSERILFTINVGVCLIDLHNLLGSPGTTPSSETECQVRARIGSLMPEQRDHWWSLEGDGDAATILREVVAAVEGYAAPYIDQYLSRNAVIFLWKSGKSPGITEQQRIRYLRELNAES